MITTLAEAEAHQRKHGFLPPQTTCKKDEPCEHVLYHKDVLSVLKPKGRQMTKTEREYSLILEAMKRRGEIVHYEYEGITLRFAGVRYTPDFVVCPSPLLVEGYTVPQRLKFIEVKGSLSLSANIYARTVERFRHARTYWTLFDFEMHQRQKGGQWVRIH
jgi:hypothetical protein